MEENKENLNNEEAQSGLPEQNETSDDNGAEFSSLFSDEEVISEEKTEPEEENTAQKEEFSKDSAAEEPAEYSEENSEIQENFDALNEDTEENSENKIPDEKNMPQETQNPVQAVEIPGSEDFDETTEPSKELITVRPVKFQEFQDSPPNRAIKKNLDIMQDISMHISVELGRTKSSIREVMEMEKGSIVELDKIAGEQVEIFVNEKLVAKGEVIVIEDRFGVRVTSTNLAKGLNS